ncbi:hypothetical protein [Chlorogloea sp. CCALA 695]|uniref:hypothetical protein n=1 Tax=Chlorogloea sp. CCALA 695 TaxID=2107693 RepID=UPI000D06D199|nr:hypothetical protein [Chlorogloea sp. CCALA 695]PSB31378.1 hypothetical protein C7B70_13695 [Chlorogloea sp. CCALA 695]
MDENNDSNAYLQAILDSNKLSNTYLKGILEELQASKQQIGFGHPPKPRYIYTNRQYPECLWYFWDGENKRHEPILFNALTGIIEKLETEEKEYKGKRSLKINLHIRAERNYAIQTGIETMFAKGLLYTLSELPVEKFKSAITIAVEPGNDAQVSFCRIYNPVTGRAAYAPYNEPVNWQHTIARAILKIDTAHGRIEQTVQIPQTTH